MSIPHDIINEYIAASYPKEHRNDDGRNLHFTPRIECADGFSMSVQGHWGAYCEPRISFSGTGYSSLEIGFPSEREELIMPYIDGRDGDPIGSVYGYVPVDVIVAVVEKHGGFKK